MEINGKNLIMPNVPFHRLFSFVSCLSRLQTWTRNCIINALVHKIGIQAKIIVKSSSAIDGATTNIAKLSLAKTLA